MYKKEFFTEDDSTTVFELTDLKANEDDPNSAIVQILFNQNNKSISYHYRGGELEISQKLIGGIASGHYTEADSLKMDLLVIDLDKNMRQPRPICFHDDYDLNIGIHNQKGVLDFVPPTSTKFTFTPTVSSGIRLLATKNTSILTVTLQNNMLHYSFSQKETRAKHIQILDYKGSIVLDKWVAPQRENTIPLPEYISNGVYFVLLETEHESYVKKVMHIE